jgi:outer membrane protein OmpA-like peptidoglycan-associated protein
MLGAIPSAKPCLLRRGGGYAVARADPSNPLRTGRGVRHSPGVPFFEADSKDLTGRANEIIPEPSSSHSSLLTGVRVRASRYADSSKANVPALDIAAGRALAVANALMMLGVPDANVAIAAYGANHLPVPTGPDEAQPQNGAWRSCCQTRAWLLAARSMGSALRRRATANGNEKWGYFALHDTTALCHLTQIVLSSALIGRDALMQEMSRTG